VSRQRGSVLPLVVATLVVAGLFLIALGRLSVAAISQARARTAADAAALAGAVRGHDAAADMAHANGAQLVAFDQPDGDTRVTVKVGAATATARARPGDQHPRSGN
jgi:outer membrane lipoprotein SlyB